MSAATAWWGSSHAIAATRRISLIIVPSSLFLRQEVDQPRYAEIEALVGCREAPAHEPLTFGTEGNARREAEPRFVHEAAAERHAVLGALDSEERVHRTGRRVGVHTGRVLQRADQAIPGAAQSL